MTGLAIDNRIRNILGKAQDDGISREEASTLLRLPLMSLETRVLMYTADLLSREMFKGKGENHFHIGINIEPCPYNCLFCSLARQTGIFTENIDFQPDQVVEWARQAEKDGADALNIMTGGSYAFEKLLEMGRLLKKSVNTPLVANTRDITRKEGEKLLEAGFVGAYHAVRLGEGKDTPFNREKRINTIKVLKETGLLWMNCIEPVGPEHSTGELVDLMFLAREYGATYSGVMRRVNFPKSPMEKYGMITEFEMARIVAVSRLVMGRVPRAHCTQEPHTASLCAGANLFFPEVGASPRDCEGDTGKGRGLGIDECSRLHRETGWDPTLVSNCFPL